MGVQPYRERFVKPYPVVLSFLLSIPLAHGQDAYVPCEMREGGEQVAFVIPGIWHDGRFSGFTEANGIGVILSYRPGAGGTLEVEFEHVADQRSFRASSVTYRTGLVPRMFSVRRIVEIRCDADNMVLE